MSKLNIEGRPIGTTAENVEYTNSDMSGVTHAKGALDNLNTRMKAVEQGGGGEIDNESLSFIATTMVKTDGIDSNSMAPQYYVSANNGNLKAGDTFGTTLGGILDYGDGYHCHTYIDINEGDVLHFSNIGLDLANMHGYVICDEDGKVVVCGQKGSVGSGTVTAPAGSHIVYINGLQGNMPRAWVLYTNRPHIKKGILQCYGDSIMSYNGSTRFYTYPLILAAKLGVTLSKHSLGGDQLGKLNNYIRLSRCDADVYLNAMGYNSIDSTLPYDEGGKEKVGTAAAALEILPANGSFKNLTSEQRTELMSTTMGMYWYYTNMLIEFAIKPTAQILCVGLFGLANDTNTNTVHKDFRKELKNLVDGISSEHPNVHFIDGKEHVLAYNTYFYSDSIHPNQHGQVMIADGLYPFLADLFGKMDIYYDNNTHPEW